jgi:XTP/dITP diphosphohydrolase
MEIVLATTNLHKIREFKDLFKALLPHLELLTLRQFPDYVPPEETGTTFRENALLKAEHAAKQLGKWALADDSGLVIPSLNGEPGVYSSRYAGLEATDKENCDKVLRNLEPFPNREDRSAHYECCLVLANPESVVKSVEGICEGYLLAEPRGRNGFGYNPLFVKNDYEKTFAELDDSVKNRISHRRKALERLLAFLENLRD